MAVPRELPMAIAACGLSPAELEAQIDRYRRLGAAAVAVEDHELRFDVSFGEAVDERLLHETITLEQQCCPFFVLGYDAERRLLSIAVEEPDRAGALATLRAALTG